MASRKNGTLYTGVTSDLCKRISIHKASLLKGFSQKYAVKLLVWHEMHETMEAAICREKQIKAWKRDWKIRLIMKDNPNWKDLFEELCGTPDHDGRKP